MKTVKKVIRKIGLLFLLVFIIMITGCFQKREKLEFKGKEGTIVFSLKAENKYKISTKSKDLRTSREQAVLIANDFKVGIELSDDYKYLFNSDFNRLKHDRKTNDDYKEVTYSNVDGIQYFYSGYMRYQVILPIKENNSYYLCLYVYGKDDNKESAKKAINSEEVIDVLNHISIISIK